MKLRIIEFIILFIGIPLLLFWFPMPVFPILWVVTIGCLIYLFLDKKFDRRLLWHKKGKIPWKSILLPFAPAAVAILVLTFIFLPERIFILPRTMWPLWLLIMVFYPVLSVYPQSVVYRTFFFHRYEQLFGKYKLFVAAFVFGFMHILFHNWIAVVLTMIGGYLFAWRYKQTNSLLTTFIEQSLYGCWIFTTGLGWYFYAGAV